VKPLSVVSPTREKV